MIERLPQTKRIINLPLLNNKYCYIYFYHLFLYTSNIQRLSFFCHIKYFGIFVKM